MRIQGLLLHSIASPLDAPRLCAVQWACSLYPFHSPVARCDCIAACTQAKRIISRVLSCLAVAEDSVSTSLTSGRAPCTPPTVLWPGASASRPVTGGECSLLA